MSWHGEMVDLLGYDPDEPVPTFPSSAPPAAQDSLDWRIAADGLAPGKLVAASDGPVAVARMHDGRLFVLADRCPHDGGRISDGFIEAGLVVCARHGRSFTPEELVSCMGGTAVPACNESSNGLQPSSSGCAGGDQ